MKKIVLIGAGSAQFGYTTMGDIFQSKVLKGSHIVLHDINPETLKRVEEEGNRFIKESGISFKISATTDRKEAVKHADFVIISIEVGDRFLLWDMDRTIPQQYGIHQVYGENGGPGGLFHSLRIIPPILDICEDVRALAPDAYIFNYSNPMSRICTTVHRKFPDLKFIGLCHEIASLERFLPIMLRVPYKNLDLTAGGLNHFSCLLKAENRKTGKDIYPEIMEKSRAFLAKVPGSTDYLEYMVESGEILDTEGSTSMLTKVKAKREWTERTLFKFMLDNFDLLPITSDSHFGEYLGWAYDVVDHRGILDFYRFYQKYLSMVRPKIEAELHERVAVIMDGLVSGEEYTELAVNLPNRKLIKELPSFIAVEVPARVGNSGVDGVALPKLPPAYAGILRNQVAVHDMTAEAILNKSKKAVVQALLVDPVVDKAKGLDQMVELMIGCQKEFLGYLE